MIFVYGFLHTFRVGSVYVTLAVTFERFHAIICPLRHFRRKKYMLPFCISFAILYNIPKYFELKIEVKYSLITFTLECTLHSININKRSFLNTSLALCTVFENHPKSRICISQFWHFPPIFANQNLPAW